jgi:hypothetical protein
MPDHAEKLAVTNLEGHVRQGVDSANFSLDTTEASQNRLHSLLTLEKRSVLYG